jgi:hypothetical protein
MENVKNGFFEGFLVNHNLYINLTFGFTAVCAGIPQMGCGTTIAKKNLKTNFTEKF